MKHYYEKIIQVKPGITGMWQTHGRVILILTRDWCWMSIIIGTGAYG